MRQRELKKLKAMLVKLTFGQRRDLLDELAAENGAAASVGIIEHAEHLHCCPHCSGERMARNGSASGLQRYKCRDCGRTFNALTGTPLARLRQ
jgi:transposase-like protein